MLRIRGVVVKWFGRWKFVLLKAMLYFLCQSGKYSIIINFTTNFFLLFQQVLIEYLSRLLILL